MGARRLHAAAWLVSGFLGGCDSSALPAAGNLMDLGASGSSVSVDAGAEGGTDGRASNGVPAEGGPLKDGGDASGSEAAADWCVARGAGHLLCEDFAEGVPGNLTARTYGGGSVAADVSDYVSLPEALWAFTPGLEPAGMAGAVGMASFDAPAKHVRVQVEIQASASCEADGDGVTVATLTFGAYALAFATTSSDSSLTEVTADGTTAHRWPIPLLPDTWQLIVIDVDLSARQVSVSVQGGIVLTQGLGAAAALAQAGSWSLSLGAEVKDVVGASSGCLVRVDDVLVDATPAAAADAAP